MNVLNKLAYAVFGSSNEREIKRLHPKVDAIDALSEEFEKFSDKDLKAKTDAFQKRLKDGESLDDILNEAFATVREAAYRTLGLKAYPVQLIGGMVLHSGRIAEMKTGEGKTLVATMPTYLNALEGKGVHVVTVNDYLAKRDADWMRPVFEFLGLSVGSIVAGMDEDARREAYACDITYGTNNEFGFDYLRDNMKFKLDKMVQRGFNFAVIDEVDSILIDEARTPLIISGPAETSSELYMSVDSIIPKLVEEDYEIDEKTKTSMLTEAGQEHVEELCKASGLIEDGGLYDPQNISIVHHVNQALKAHKLFAADTDYIVKEGKVILIDEFTGRMMDGRRLSEGLHQAIEAKEGVPIENENQTLASITFQNYFRLYPKLSGMTGTAMTEAAEFEEIYGLQSVEIPTHRPIARIDEDDQIYPTFQDKLDAIIKLIKECQDRQQPVLVGTTSIDKSELLSGELKKLKIKHNVLNARYHEQEAYIVSQAGRPGNVTIATNMAGRGTDIKLGGNAEMLVEHDGMDLDKATALVEKDKDIVLEAGGLMIIGTERHESRRIDNQLRGRSGRQGDPGASIFFLSLEDDLMRIFGAERLKPLLSSKNIGLQDGEALTHPLISRTLERAQRKVESQHFDIRKNLLKFDDVMNDQRKIIYEQRMEIMSSEHVSDVIEDMRLDNIEDLIARCMPKSSYPEDWDIETLTSETQRLFALELPFKDWANEEGIADIEIEERVKKAVAEKMADKVKRYTEENMQAIEKAILLQQLDTQWKEHLHGLDQLRQGISLRAYGQRDPLNEYKTEAFMMFEQTLADIRESTVQILSFVEIDLDATAKALQETLNKEARQAELREGRIDPAMAGQRMGAADAQRGASSPTPFPNQPLVHSAFDKDNPETWTRTPRNAPCPCGSGKKYKHCHGKIG